MNDRVSVGTSFADTAFILCLVAGPIGLGGGAVIFAGEGDRVLAVIVAGVGLMLLVLGLARGVWLAAGRRWICDTDRGFVLEAHGREHKFDDDEVLELAAKTTTRFANGVPKANVRKGTLRVDSALFPKPVAFRYEWPLDREDPLLDLFERLLGRLAKQAEKELARDGELVGDGWSLTRDGLELPAADEPAVLRFERMAAAEVVDGQVCVWESGEPKPVFQVPLDTPNAPVLLEVLVKRLADRPAGDDHLDDPESLGRVIFERDASHTKATLFVGGLFAVGLFLGGAAALYFFLTLPPADRPPLVLSIIPSVIAAAVAAALWFGRQNVLRCHARGVCHLKNGKTTEMRYDEVKVFTYSATRNYHKGSYTGTILSLQFEGVDGRKLNYTITVRNADDSLDNLREHVGRVVAGGMKRRLDAGKAVYWTDRVTFEPDGIAIAGKSGLFGKGDDLFVEWDDVADVAVDGGHFALYADGRKKAVYQTPVATPNFFPGYYLILRVRFPRRRHEPVSPCRPPPPLTRSMGRRPPGGNTWRTSD
jgi:hypothetical protein